MFKRIITLVALTMTIISATAQTQDMMAVVPNDPELRTGTLPGGSRYYIRANKKDPQRANFHIVYEVGAVQEGDNQNGLAHFLEHMAFNGSKNFPDNTMIDYLQSIGVRFGENLNAGTAQQLTTYMITNVPITRDGIVDSALMVLHDWAGFISLNEKDIDDERGVIREEWRQGNNAQWRVMEKQLPVQFNNTIFAKRNVIGNEEVLKSFTYQDIKDFYHKWYRPDLQAFIIVGDFDVDQMEAKLKTVMSDVQASSVQTPKEKVTIPYNETPQFAIVADPELTSNSVEVSIRQKGLAKKYNNTVMAAKNDIIDELFNMMINERLTEIALKDNAPFMNAVAHHSQFGDMFGYPVDGYNAMAFHAKAKDGNLNTAFQALLTEMYRAQRGGFTTQELERSKAKMLSQIESKYNNRNDQKNGDYVDAIEWSFLFNSPIPSAQTEFDGQKQLLETTTLDEINTSVASWFPEQGWVVMVSMPAKEGNPVPTQEELETVIAKVKSSEIEIFKEEEIVKPLISSKLKGSKVIATEQGQFESTIWTLKNGARVIIKPSTLKADELMMNASQLGGTSKLTELGVLYSAQFYPALVQMSGLGDFSATELSKVLSGKIASCSPRLGSFSQGFTGSCAPKDLETMLQLLYLNATAPRMDTSSLNVLMAQLNNMLPNLIKNPDYIIQDSLSRIFYDNNPRAYQLNMDILKMLTIDNFRKVYSEALSSAGSMTYTFVGNVDLAILKPLVEKYIGSLPSSKSKAEYGNLDPTPVKGEVKKSFKTTMETPKVTAFILYSGNWENTPQNDVTIQTINRILEIRYTKSVREEAGGTYGVGTQMVKSTIPTPNYIQYIMFNTDASKIDTLLPIIYKEINDLMTDGPRVEDLDKVKENLKKKFAESNNSNGTWMGYLIDYYVWNEDNYTDRMKYFEALTPAMVRDLAKQLFDQGNICTVVQMPIAK